MTLARSASVLALLLVAVPAQASGDRLGTNVRPISQSIDLKIDPSQGSYSGSTRIALEITGETDAIRLHAEGLEISELQLEGGSGVLETSSGSDGDVLTVRSEAGLAPGRYGLRIAFTNEFNTQAVGLYRMESAGLSYAFTQFEAVDARKAFPCFDEPSFKIPFELRITAREADTVVSNTPIRRESREGGWRTLDFQTTRPLPTYLLAIAVGPMDSIEMPGLGVPGRIYTPRGQSGLAAYAASMTAPILKAHEAYFGTPYPYEKLDFIAISEYWPGAMEHPGAITFKDDILLLEASHVSAAQRRTAARVISHELAHQWFGNLVTMAWWDDLWLNEAFADWLGDKIVVQLYPEMKHDLNELRQVNGVMSADARVTAEAVRRPVSQGADLLSSVGLAYYKGKAVIAMFERWIGPETFRNGVHAYLHDNAWRNAEAGTFWSALSAAAGADVASAMETFLVQPGMPLVRVTIDGNAVVLRQERFASHGTRVPTQRWKIPVGLRIGTGNRIVEKTVLLTEPGQRVEIEGPAPDWVMPDADGAGYYRWTVGDERLVALAARAQTVLSERERVAFLGNTGALVDGGLLGGDAYMKILEVFAGDAEPLVVSAAISQLARIEEAFVTDDLEDEFSSYVGKTLTPALERFGLDPRAGEDETVTGFRPRLLTWLGTVGKDAKVVAWAKVTGAKYLEDPSSLDPALGGAALAIRAKTGDQDLFDRMKRGFVEATNPAVRANYLGALGRFDDPTIRRQALAFALEGPLRPNEMFDIPNTIGESSADADLIFDWTTTNYDRIAARMPPMFLPFLTGIGGGCDKARLARAKAFFATPEHSVEGTEKAMKRVEASVLDCVGLREREGPRVRAFLEGR